MGGTEWQYVKDAFDSNWIAPAGPHITTFENNLSKISNDYHIAALSSGTSAIHLALLLLGVKREDEVLCWSNPQTPTLSGEHGRPVGNSLECR